MKLLVFGAAGQLGREACAAARRRDITIAPLTRAMVDLVDVAAVRAAVLAERPDMILNAAAYTQVDAAEEEAAAAFAVNAAAPEAMAAAAADIGAGLIQISTDYVFDGASARPYVETDAPNPINAYGRTKLAGEQAVAAACPRHLIVRAAWLYSRRGSNFVRTMLQLARTRDALDVVDDQHGSPTSAADLAAALIAMALAARRDDGPWGLFHLAGAGETTWRGFADAIFEEAARHGGPTPRVRSTTTAAFGARAPRPARSVLACEKAAQAFGVRLQPWRAGLAPVVAALTQQEAKA